MAGQVEQPGQAGRVGGVGRDEGGALQPVEGQGGHFRGQTQGAAEVAQGAAGAEGDEGAGHGHVLGAVTPVEVLDDFFAARGVEVDVNVGDVGAFGGEETLEDEGVGVGVDGRDTEQIGDEGVGGGAAPLTADALRAGVAHDVPDDEEVVGQAGGGDDAEFIGQGVGQGGGLGVARQGGLAQLVEIDFGRFSLRRGKRGQALQAIAQLKIAPLGDTAAGRQRRGVGGEGGGQFGAAAQGVTGVERAGGVPLRQRDAPAQADEQIVQRVLVGGGVMHVVRGHDFQTERFGQAGQLPVEPGVAGLAVMLQFHIEPVGAEEIAQAPGGAQGGGAVVAPQGGRHFAAATTGEAQQPGAMPGQSVGRQRGLAFGGVMAGQRDEGAQVAPAGAILRQQGEVAAAGQGQFGAEDGLDARLPGCLDEGHRAIDGVMVGQGQGGQAQGGGALDQGGGGAGAI